MVRALIPAVVLLGFIAAGPLPSRDKNRHLKSSEHSRLVGQFRDSREPERIFSFSTHGNVLYLQMHHVEKTALTAVSKTELVCKEPAFHFWFDKDESGEFTALRWSYG